jgi:PBSX family phage terminase large subunit
MAATAAAKKRQQKKRNVTVTLSQWDPNASFRKKRVTGVMHSTKAKIIPMHAPTMKASEMFLPAFHSFWRASRAEKHLYYVLKGGRNSSKSTHIGEDIIFDTMQQPINTLVIRKVGNTLKDSVYEQLKWAAEFLGVSHLFTFGVSPMHITYKPRGNKIIFRGADKPEKIKSIKSAKFPIARLWVEELAEFKTEDEVSTIVNSVTRSELPEIEENGKTRKLEYKVYFSYNPPKRKQSWVNKKFETHNPPANMFIHHSTYLDNPHVSRAFIEEAEEVKRSKPLKYRWEYMGEAIGAGIVPFTNLTFRAITDEEYKTFDNIRQGLDWGYGADPLAFVRLHFDKTRRRLYMLDEYYAVKTSNRAIAEWIKAKGYTDTWIIADSAEPKSIDELRTLGVTKIKGAKKGAGSIEHGEKWLDDLDEIVIDAKRTPNIAKEFEDIDYKTDADGNVRNELEDKDNHTIDSTRYAVEDDTRNGGPAKAVSSIM